MIDYQLLQPFHRSISSLDMQGHIVIVEDSTALRTDMFDCAHGRTDSNSQHDTVVMRLCQRMGAGVADSGEYLLPFQFMVSSSIEVEGKSKHNSSIAGGASNDNHVIFPV